MIKVRNRKVTEKDEAVISIRYLGKILFFNNIPKVRADIKIQSPIAGVKDKFWQKERSLAAIGNVTNEATSEAEK